MWPYWLMYLIPGILAAAEHNSRVSSIGESNTRLRFSGKWVAVALLLTSSIGLRFEVGGDWFNYLRNYENAEFLSRYSEWWLSDPGYRLLEWIAMQAGWGIVGVNVLAAIVFVGGLVSFCNDLPRPWLALAAAVPYLVVILGMGYSRQGVALGVIMLALISLGRGNPLRFTLLSFIGATFHSSAIVMLPMAALAASKGRLFLGFWIGVVLLSLFISDPVETIDRVRIGYIDAEYQSQGALIRLLMNAVPAVLLIALRNRFSVTLPQERLWFWCSVASLFLLGAFFISASSTLLDRIALYFLPLQLMVFSHLPEVLGRKSGRGNGLWVVSVLVYYATVQFVWLNFAVHAEYWIPYRWYPAEVLFN